MGSEVYDSEKPIHEVELDTFYIGQHVVTQNVWKEVMGDNPSYFKGDQLPVEQVSWEDVHLFLEKLNELLELDGDRKYRLPTEAEWEYAAKGGPYSCGTSYAGGSTLEKVGWYFGNSENHTRAVGILVPNELGIYDMSGNVWEWCLKDDQKVAYKKGLTNSFRGFLSNKSPVFRGGSYGNESVGCHIFNRGIDGPPRGDSSIGFRLAKTTV